MTYTLTTEDVRRDYREYDLAWGSIEEQDEERARNDARFDRWYAEEIRKAKAEAWHEGFCRGDVSGAREMPLNPYTENPYKEKP